jgi:hypothetical protein
MAKTDITGLLTGVSKQGIDPLTAGNFAQRTLARQQQNIGTMQRGLGGLISGKPPVEQRLARGIINKQKQQKNAFADYMEKTFPNSGVRELVETGVVTPDNFRDFFGSANAQLRQGSRYTVRDAEGNLFAMTTKFDNSTGSFDTVYAPIGESPAKPTGKVEILTKEGITFQEKEEIEIASADAINTNKEYKKAKLSAIDAKLNISANTSTLNRALNLLKQVDTGGVFNNISLEAQKFFGQQPEDSAELEFILANRVLENLKSTFGGVISEGERQYLISISPNIYRGNKANRAILERLATIQKNAERRNNLLLNSNTFEDYTNAVKGYRFEEMDAVEDIIDFAELN